MNGDMRFQIAEAARARAEIEDAGYRIETAVEKLAEAIDELDAVTSGKKPATEAEDVLEADQSSLAVLLDALEDMVAQHCRGADSDPFDYDSCALSANAQAMRLLAAHGRLVVVSESGRRVLARQAQRGSV